MKRKTAAHRQKISAAMRGKKPSDETRAKMSASQKARKRVPFSPEHRAAISAGLRLAHRKRQEKKLEPKE